MSQTNQMTKSDTSEMSNNRKVRFLPIKEFEKQLKLRVEEYFNINNLSKRDSYKMYRKTSIVLVWLVSSYSFLVFFALPVWGLILSAISLCLALNAVGFNIMHDGNHRAYSNNPVINRMMAFSLDLIGGSSYYWFWKHNYLHHTYPNITGLDDDLEAGFIVRITPHQKRYLIHRFQHIYIWFFYGFLVIKWNLYGDFSNFITKKIHEHTFPRPKGRELFLLIFGKVCFISLAFIIPSLFYPFLYVLLFYFSITFVQGVVLTTVFQLAHCNDEVEFLEYKDETDRLNTSWIVHQLETTADFSRDNKILNWYIGGLNFQVEHHLFPKVCHIHYPAISKIVEQTCKEFGVRYNSYNNLHAGILSHYRWIYQMGRA